MNAILAEAFRHGAWATQQLIGACRGLDAEQLQRPAPGFGSILATLLHVVRADGGYLRMLTGDSPPWLAEEASVEDLDRIEAWVVDAEQRWARLLADGDDPERRLVLDEGAYECAATVVYVQALHHGHAHREQIRSALRALEVSTPDLQPWEFALDVGRAHWLREP